MPPACTRPSGPKWALPVPTEVRATILDLEMTSELDAPSLEMLEKLLEEHQDLGLQFMLASLHGSVGTSALNVSAGAS